MLKHDIGINAGVIWRLLSSKGALSIRQIGEFTHLEEKMIGLSLGWLAREDKIRFFEKNGVICAELIPAIPEMYF
ncbi:MAG: winged helix-turn-helix domain-containing protein [Bacteroidales bacterium]|jgi:hypothetical protein|nr:winged helix-turn-helix domain-containing protein [Bacteroidales bacterium]